MPVSVIVGGQFGSEGKGKVALATVRRHPRATIAVRPGGTNSGHTAIRTDGSRVVLRQLPAAAIDGTIDAVIPAGAYVDVALLEAELDLTGLNPARLHVDPRAHVIHREHLDWESEAGLGETIASTGSGTGAAALSRMARLAPSFPPGRPAADCARLGAFVRDTAPLMRAALARGERVVVEGTQGFGLSPIHGDSWPKATSRDTTAAAFLSEAGLAPTDVDDVALVLRAWPIRVAGDSGPLAGETSWPEIAKLSGGPWAEGELTSVTRRLRRVGRFDPDLVRRAIAANQPTRIILNHLDQVDYSVHGSADLTEQAAAFVRKVEADIDRSIDEVGTGEATSVRLRETA